MCGIFGAIAKKNIMPLIIEGLERLEYRGYDSAGVAIHSENGTLQRIRSVGKVSQLKSLVEERNIDGKLGIGHTRWATHGIPSERNAHPHMSGEQVAVVHNGIIENHNYLKSDLKKIGYAFSSETDTEVIAHLLGNLLSKGFSLVDSVREACGKLVGAYGMAVSVPEDSDRIVVAKSGSPIVIGIGKEETYIASDVFALLPLTKKIIFLEEGDIAEITCNGVTISTLNGQSVDREIRTIKLSSSKVDKGPFEHFMLKEIFEQPSVISETLEGRIYKGHILEESFGPKSIDLLNQTKNVHIVACGTSYHAGLIAKYWLEEVGVPCSVEIASEYRYRKVVVPKNTLFVSISQSGETADTLAALRSSKKDLTYLGNFTICNVPESSLVRESDVALMTRAGVEIGVASTKAYTTQLVALRLFVIALARRNGLSQEKEKEFVDDLESLPRQVEVILKLSDKILMMANSFVKKNNALFLGRGTYFPVAMEGALKLKEISYIHAEAYPAGELKHGPLALVDENMPVICALPDDPLLEKVLSNLQEVRARGGELFLFSDKTIKIDLDKYQDLKLDDICPSTAPIVYSIPLQLLAYHVAVLKGTNVDQPRNLAKSVTVE